MTNESVPPVGVISHAKISVAAITREYRLIVPEHPGAAPVPLVFAFHGRGDSKDQMPLYTGLPRFAQQHNFILVFPNAQRKFWPLVPLLAQDDLAFFNALYEKLTSEYPVDRARVYLTGMSNGAYFAHLVASLNSEKIAAVAAHSGGLGLVHPRADMPHKYAVLLIHGETDTIVRPAESRRALAAYEAAGHPAHYLEIPNYGHFWAGPQKINATIWDFFKQHPLSP